MRFPPTDFENFSKRKDHPPGPSPISLIAGRLLEGTFLSEKTLIELAQQYGNVYSLWGGNYYIIVFSGYQTVKEALTKHAEAFADRPVTPFILTVCKQRGIACSNGHVWLQQRRLSVVTMRKLGLGKKGLETQIQAEVERFLEDFGNKKGQPFAPSVYITHFVSNVICAVVFGHRFSTEDKEFLELLESMDIISKFLTSFSHISKDEPNSTYDEDNLVHCIGDIFIAGTDSTSSVLQWALLLMATHPDIQDKVYKEIETVLDPSHSICYGDRKNLPYTNAVIHEIIRSKYVTFFGLPRKCVKDVYLNGFLIPKGAMIFPDLRSVLLDPEQWETPEKFNPNHFLDKEGHFVTKEAFMPFGAGARSCVGELFARIEIFIMFTSLLRAFRLQPPEGVEKLSEEPVLGITLHPFPFKICAVPRSRTP
ncbi:cytochrome P450 2K6-like [Protobothrops mucrosquamatus]|uniref:cytochrome P450 2K6-like n=1 Tax=Protobothrops mucrosquamatus TaxID=103944 RepID=UPI000775A142|nr:cytochrome P450 2K6-like [Protobothrops mucrosquamatus]